jgi:hypothetical protein
MKPKIEFKNGSWTQFKQPLALQASVLLLCLVALNSLAQTHTVTNCTEANLRAAMAGGGTVTFSCDGTILLANTITNVSDTTLDASGRQVTISGNKAVRVFYVNTNVSFTLVNLTVANGTSLGGSAILNLGGTVNLTGVSFRSNTATIYVSNDDLTPRASGGAIFNRGGTVNATNCSFAGNTAQTTDALFPPSAWVRLVYGGAIRNEAGQVALRSCAFVGNRAAGGAVIYSASYGDPGYGGAIHNSGTVTLDLCTFAGNSASGGTAPPYPQWAGFSGSEGSGGAIFNQGTLTADRTTLSGNTATGGSGLWGTGSSYTLDGFPGGAGGAAFGAAICNMGSLRVTRSTFASNVVTGGAGGGGGDGRQQLDPHLGGNGGRGGDGRSGLGGALFNNGAASLVNCTIAFNTGNGGAGGGGGAGALGYDYGGSGGAGGNGGSGFGGVDGTCNLINCTVAWNLGNAGSGGAGGAAGFSPQHPGTPGAPGGSGAAWGGTVCSTLVNTLIASNTPAGNDSFTDPKLGPLADNGGSTLTMRLLPGSPAIDAGNNASAPPTDQRGVPRPVGVACDIGAYEYNPPIMAMPPPTQTVEIGSAAVLSARATGFPPPTYQWFFNGNALTGCTNFVLYLSNVGPAHAGAYTVVVRDVDGSVTSAPAMLNIIAAVDRRPVLGVKVTGETGSLLNVDYANSLSPAPDWTTLGSVSLTSTSQFYFDLSAPLLPQRFYRAWQKGTPSVVPSLNLNFVPAITLTGNVGDTLRLDYINAIGPTDAWVTLDTVTLTNTSQLYFDVSALGQPQRLYRLIQLP